MILRKTKGFEHISSKQNVLVAPVQKFMLVSLGEILFIESPFFNISPSSIAIMTLRKKIGVSKTREMQLSSIFKYAHS